METDEAREFLREHHRAVMATHRRDGRVQLSPVMTTIDGEGRAVISTRETAVKVSNLRRDPRTYLCVFTDGFFGPWVRVDGSAEIVSLPEAMPVLIDYYRRIQGEHEDWDDYRRAMREERRAVVRVTIEEVGPTVSG